jgi:hypothetical protein
MIKLNAQPTVLDYLKEITQQLDELKKALNEVPAAASELAVAMPQNITDKKIEYRDADNSVATKEEKKELKQSVKGRKKKVED